MRTSIKFKIIFSFCILIILMLLGQIIFNTYFSKEFFLRENMDGVEELFYKIKTSYSDDEEILYELTEDEDTIQGFSVQVFSSEEVIYSSRTMPSFSFGDKFEKALLNSQLNQDFSLTPTANLVNFTDDNNQMLFLNGKFNYQGEERYITISKPVQSIDDSIDLFTRSNLIISTSILLIGIIVIFIIARQISAPINSIASVASGLSNLDFSYSADENSSTLELSNLAKSINSMSSQLEKSMRELQSANVKLLEDIEYQKKIEENRKHFIANISHEMKTPFALLQMYSENLKNDIEGIDKDEYLNTIIDETKRLDLIVKDMLNISSVENGLAKVRKEEFNISETVTKLLSTMSIILSDFSLITDIEPSLYVFADKKQIEEAMRNYIINAVSHTENGNTIIITLRRDYKNIVFSVYNEGKKISSQDMNEIWDSFYKSDKSRTRKDGKNAGLGLYIVKLICENNAGTYHAENKNNGVEFSFFLTITS